MACGDNCQCPKCMVQPNDPRNLKFSEATQEQLDAFWRGEGWTKEQGIYERETVALVDIGIWDDGDLEIANEIIGVTFTTFGEALDAANELAATKVFGGWR